MHQLEITTHGINFFDQSHVFLHDTHVIVLATSNVMRKLCLQRQHSLLEMLLLALVFLVHIRIYLIPNHMHDALVEMTP